MFDKVLTSIKDFNRTACFRSDADNDAMFAAVSELAYQHQEVEDSRRSTLAVAYNMLENADTPDERARIISLIRKISEV